LRAWLYLVWLSWQRQARARQMVWIALGLLALSTGLVGFNTALGRWGSHYYRMWPRDLWADDMQMAVGTVARAPAAQGLVGAAFGAARTVYDLEVLERTAFLGFSQAVVFEVFLSFLLPMWSLSFATEAVGGEREGNSLIWLMTRPLPRPAIYLAKFVALLPWSVGLNVGGFALLCLAGGRNGAQAFRLYWPAVLWATFAFSALFYLMGAYFRRPAVVAIVYSFFLEIILGNMPGILKRFSISFYARCLMFEAAQEYGLQPEKPSVYLPVEGGTALAVLVGLTFALLALGAVVFSRSQYQDVV
jgi:ABC-type transport system involved in multi-copper enzyme maturation permease subunit